MNIFKAIEESNARQRQFNPAYRIAHERPQQN